MVIPECEIGVDQKDVNVPRSPWRKPTIDGNGVDVPVIVVGTESWPALSDAQKPKNQIEIAAVAAKSENVATSVPSSAENTRKAPSVKKSNASRNFNQVHKMPSKGHQKPGAKHNTNTAPPFPVPMHYHQPAVRPYLPPMVPPPHIAAPAYVPPTTGYLPSVENPLVKPVSQALPGHTFAPPSRAVDAKNVQRPVQGDPNAYIANYSNGRPNIREQGDHLNHAWHHQRPFPMHHGVDPSPFIRPPFYGPPPGYMVDPSFTGPAPVYRVPMPPPGSIRGPYPQHFVPLPVNSAPQPLTPETSASKISIVIVKQIEYYFRISKYNSYHKYCSHSRLLTSEPSLCCEENLQDDHYLISLMDDQGWVPISTITEFRRVKRMSTDKPFILDALQSSSNLEVQGGKIRKRNNWSKWVQVSSGSSGSQMAQVQQSQPVEDADNSCQNSDAVGNKATDFSVANFTDAARNSICTEQNQSTKETFHVYHTKQEQDTESHPFNGTSHAVTGERETASNNFCCHSRETESKIVDYYEAGNMEVLTDTDIRDLSNDFGNTFLLDEEMELEQKMLKKTELSPNGR